MLIGQGVSTFNDDIESTAAAVVASFLGAEQLQGVPQLKDQTILMLGAGQANIGGAKSKYTDTLRFDTGSFLLTSNPSLCRFATYFCHHFIYLPRAELD
jgi:hypothetical protein